MSINAYESLYSKISPREIQAASLQKPVWGLVLDRYTRRVLLFGRGYRLAIYDNGLTTVIHNEDLPANMTSDNCGEYRYVNGRFTHLPLKARVQCP